MARRRVLVAIVPPATVAEQVRTLRWALGDRRPERIVPHVTVVPPFNVATDDVDRFRRHIRSVVLATTPFSVSVSGLATFAPSTPTIHLEVHDGGSGALTQLRSRLGLDGLVPVDGRPFRPHMTVRSRASDEQIEAALVAGSPLFSIPVNDPTDGSGDPASDPRMRWEVGSVQLMEQHHRAGIGTLWQPIAEEPFGPPVVVGRGGVELVIRTTAIVDTTPGASGSGDAADHSEGVEHERSDEWSEQGAHDAVGDRPGIDAAHGQALCVTAERPDVIGRPIGSVVGKVRGPYAGLHWLRVGHEHRGMGVGRQMLAHWIHGANVAGADVVLFETTDADAECPELVDFLAGAGFTRVGRWLVRDSRSEPG